MEIAIGLGSNMGNRLDNLRRARHLLSRQPGFRLTETAPVYETSPVDVPPEFKAYLFLNSAVLLESDADAGRILKMTQSVEKLIGRNRSRLRNNAPRLIDVDIIYAGDIRIDSPELCIPHPRWMQRNFVVRPLADLRPNLVIKGEKRTLSMLSSALGDDGIRPAAEYPWW